MPTQDRFRLLDPEERDALRILVQNHLNTISEISLHKDFRVIGYLDWLAKIEDELNGLKRAEYDKLRDELADLRNQLDIANQLPCSLSVHDNLEATVKNQMEIIREYYEHNKNNMQICGLNYMAKQALKGD